ncbi:DUF6350 family protein [Microbacterium sp. M28]|uniref:cell division protein PerM n=1 Tax=Microbacterium sp. M28 TaxID=2962064 RepID=UPI0021F41A1A|nr:DUF6350 family protein [Microbacterium sp. M28]UYO96280.1 DUF6350 family protein [Microbacterium sp. M28]
MQRLLVALLAAVDAAIAAAVGLTVLLAPLTLLWTFAFGVDADWGALWPATGILWQFGHAVPLDVVLPDEMLVAVGIGSDAAVFTLSVAPMAFLLFTIFAAARSGRRAARSGAWGTGVLAGSAAFAAITTGVVMTSHVAGITASPVLGILFPAGCYLVGAVGAAVVEAWREGDDGLVDRVHDAVDGWGDCGPVPAEALRGTAIVTVILTGVGALSVALMVLLRGSEVVTLFEAARVDGLGATVITLGQLAYLPTVIVWAVSWLAGPGFAVGVGTAVSPAGTQLGVVPGIPMFGLMPEHSSIWMLIVVLIPVAAGAVAGWMVRSRLVWEQTAVGWAPRAVIAGGIAALSALVAGLAASAASGSIGPGRLADVGPHPGWFALAIGAEVLVGAGILLLSPRNRDELAEERTDRWTAQMGVSPVEVDAPIAALHARADAVLGDEGETAPIDESGFFRDDRGDGGTSDRR